MIHFLKIGLQQMIILINFLTLTSTSFGILFKFAQFLFVVCHWMCFFYFNLHLNLAGPTVDSNMTLSILSSRDAVTNIAIAFSFNVSYGPPSRVFCRRIGTSSPFLNTRDPNPKLDREVIRSRYINITLPDMTRVTVRPDPQPRKGATYACIAHVESRINIASGIYDYDEKGASSTTITVTGELYSWIYTFHLLLVVSPPTGVSVSRTGFNSVLVSWSAPSSAVPAGYEVFYQVDGDSTLSAGNTSNTELTLTGLTLGTHSLFVVGYGAEGAPVLPSAHSNTTSVVIGEIVNKLTQQQLCYIYYRYSSATI